MPCLEITMPEVDEEKKETLISRLTEAFCTNTGHPKDIFCIFLHEFQPGSSGKGGALWDGKTGSPPIHMVLSCPRLKRSVKQKVVAELTSAFTASLKQADWFPIIHLSEHPYDNVGLEGKLLTDQFPELQKRKFYYPLEEPQP